VLQKSVFVYSTICDVRTLIASLNIPKQVQNVSPSMYTISTSI